MGDKTSNFVEKPRRRISRAGRRAMAKGAENLVAWRERADKRANDLEAEVASFRARLLEDCGPTPSASRVGLVESATTTYAAIVRIRREVIRGPKSKVANLVDRASWLTGNLSRLLKQLNLDAKPRPRTFADILASKVDSTPSIDSAKGPNSTAKSA